MLKKFLVTASVAAMLAGAANAVVLENNNAVLSFDEPYPLADAIDFAATSGTLDVTFGPSAGTFPTGNVLLFVTVTGATFDGGLDGTEVTGPGSFTSVISNGGISGQSTVTFLISEAQGCAVPDESIGQGLTECGFSIPVDLTGSDVSVSVGLETDAGADVDNSNRNTRVSAALIDLLPAFSTSIIASTTPSIADLNAGSGPFEAFTLVPVSDGILGTVEVATNEVDYGAGIQPVNVDLSFNPVSGADIGSIDILISGTMDAFSTPPGDVTINGNSANDIDDVADTAAYDAASDFGLDTTGPMSIVMVPDGATAMARSDYTLSVTVVPDALSLLQSGTSDAGDLQSIDRNGTQVTFPWTQTSTQGAASGTTSVFRIGNLDVADAGAVFVEVKNASEPGYTNPGVVQLAPSIPGSGELVQNSTQLETALGNYGRGDIEFTIEADPDTLTARQFVVRNGVIQQVIGGNVDQDINN
jgi:hypothetical protein